jgi:peptidyl-tRNA hydrolase, PTH1 family
VSDAGSDAVPDHASGAGRGAGGSGAWVVAGLGNAERSYATTRHNIGHVVVEELAERLGAGWRRHRTGRADTVEGRLGPPGPDPAPRLVLVRTRGYMNETGPPVAAVASYEGVAPERLVCIHDELDLPLGTVRAKHGGGDNGHNGLRSVRRALGTGDFGRVRVGIGRPPGRQDPADFVLSTFTAVERRELGLIVALAADVTESLILRGLALTQSDFHARQLDIG